MKPYRIVRPVKPAAPRKRRVAVRWREDDAFLIAKMDRETKED